jgi:hypothetical protein
MSAQKKPAQAPWWTGGVASCMAATIVGSSRCCLRAFCNRSHPSRIAIRHIRLVGIRGAMRHSARVLTEVVAAPPDLLKVRMQTAVGGKPTYTGTVKAIIKQDGPRGLFAGLSARLERLGGQHIESTLRLTLRDLTCQSSPANNLLDNPVRCLRCYEGMAWIYRQLELWNPAPCFDWSRRGRRRRWCVDGFSTGRSGRA